MVALRGRVRGVPLSGPDPLGDRGERVLIQHTRPFQRRPSRGAGRPRQIGIASGPLEDLKQQRHFFAGIHRASFSSSARSIGRPQQSGPSRLRYHRLIACRSQLHRRPSRKCVWRSPAGLISRLSLGRARDRPNIADNQSALDRLSKHGVKPGHTIPIHPKRIFTESRIILITRTGRSGQVHQWVMAAPVIFG